MAKKNSVPVKVYGIDDFITDMERPMPYIDTLSRIHLLTGFNKSALWLLSQYLDWIIDYKDLQSYRMNWITKHGIRWGGVPEGTLRKVVTPLQRHHVFLVVAIDCLIKGDDIPTIFMRDRIAKWASGFDPLHPFYTKSESSLRAQALVRFYTRERVLKKEGKLYEHYNKVSKARYRRGRAIAKNDRLRYYEDHEMCGKILKSMNDRKAVSQWQDDRNLLKKDPDFMDYYDSE